MTDRLAELTAAGVAVWLDDLSRGRLTTGSLDQLRREKHVVGVTTNPTIFAKALADADDYDDQVKRPGRCAASPSTRPPACSPRTTCAGPAT